MMVVSAVMFASIVPLLKESHVSSLRMISWVETLKSVPADIWNFYIDSMIVHPLLVPAVITGVTYFIADWVRSNNQCLDSTMLVLRR